MRDGSGRGLLLPHESILSEYFGVAALCSTRRRSDVLFRRRSRDVSLVAIVLANGEARHREGRLRADQDLNKAVEKSVNNVWKIGHKKHICDVLRS